MRWDVVMINLQTQAVWLLCLYVATLMLVLCDLWSGVRKAKLRGEYRSSFGFRKTVTKLTSYYNLQCVLTIVDVLCALVIINGEYSIALFPYFTLLGVFFVAFIEIKSIYEKADKKQKTRTEDAMNTLIKIVHNKDDIAKVLEALKNNNNEDK